MNRECGGEDLVPRRGFHHTTFAKRSESMSRKRLLRLEELESRCLLSNAVFHTRSIVAADPATGQVGMAVVSFPTGVPAVVPVGEPGVIVANQSTPSYATAQAIIAGIHAGEDAPTALANAVAADPTRANRQLGVAALSDKSPTGVTVATYTGSSASLQRCGLTGDVYAVQANLQTSDQVCQAMADGFEKAQGSLARRLLAAMEAGSAVGGDQRGEYSATLRVFSNRWEFASYTPIAVSANVDRSSDWFSDLKFGTDAYLSFWTRGDQADRVELTKDRALGIQEALQGLGYFQGDVNGNWMPDSEQALRDFSQRNLAFFRFTTVEQGVRYIDGPLADHIVQGYARGVFRPAPGGAPAPGDSNAVFHTRSIVAADPATGQVGMAVVSFPTGVPAVVPVGEAGVIIANQSTPSYATAQAIIAGIHA